ncbi:MAG: IclR family transcriptional regulator [Solirubrobacteraceae bacterium]|nr:IclR family transcriptional regulator [Solirubrobacteraceae bacterium]
MSRVQVISRAADVLRALHGEPDGLSLSQLAERTSLPRSTVHRLLAALETEGFVSPSDATGRMVLGPELLRLADPGPPDVQARLRPTMDALFDDLQETVDLAILDGDHLRFVDQIPASHRLRAVSSVGATFPLHCTANGKAVLALLSDDAVTELLPARLPRFTEHTITSRRELIEHLAEIRESGLATDLEEHTLGISAIGFAVGRAAISVPMPTQRFTGREALLRRTLSAARVHAADALAG